MFQESQGKKKKEKKSPSWRKHGDLPYYVTRPYLSGCWGCHWLLVRYFVPFSQLLRQQPWRHPLGLGAGLQSANMWQIRGPALQGKALFPPNNWAPLSYQPDPCLLIALGLSAPHTSLQTPCGPAPAVGAQTQLLRARFQILPRER